MKTNSKIKLTSDDRIMYSIVYIVVSLYLLILVYPLVYVISSSFSSGSAVTSGKVLLWPVEFSTKGYEMVFAYKSVWTGYKNTIFYTVVGTILNVVLTTMAAYPLSRKNFQGRAFFTTIFMITMFFSGGIIPTYILFSNLGLVNTRGAIILSGTVSVYNMIIMRTFFQNSIPEELHEAAVIDGITDFGYLFKIVIPLSKAIYAVITLYYAVAHWNNYFSSMMYLRGKELQPLQIVLRDILSVSRINPSDIEDAELLAALVGIADVMKYSLIIVSALPILVAYPIVSKFFEKGVMIGSVKG